MCFIKEKDGEKKIVYFSFNSLLAIEHCDIEIMPFTSTVDLSCKCRNRVILSPNPRVGFLVSKLDNGLVNNVQYLGIVSNVSYNAYELLCMQGEWYL